MSLRVHLLYESDRFGNPHGSGHIRLLRPFSHPALTEHFIISTGADLPDGDVDVVVVERGWRADATLESAEALVAAIRTRGAGMVYTLDDNLLDLHRCQPWHEFSTDTKRNIVRCFLRSADCVAVSTEPLKKRLQHLNSRIVVVENALDERLFLSPTQNTPPPRLAPSNGKLVIGYMGTHSHLRDILMVLEPLRAILRRYQNKIEFQLVGISEDRRITQSFESLPFSILDTAGNHFYPDFVPWAKQNLNWDIAIAPLEDNEFTRSKSDIKFLDYALLGIPAIYSSVEAYRHTVRHKVTGYLAENNPAAWKFALIWLIEDEARRRTLSCAAFSHVIEQRVLKHCATNWKNVIFSAAEKRSVVIS